MVRAFLRKGIVQFFCMAVAASALMGVSTQPATEPIRHPENAILDIVYSGNRMSELEPCGCQSNMQGGIDREATYISRLKNEPLPVLMIDSGGFVHGTASPQNFLKTRYLMKSLAHMGYSVMNVGYSDLAYGIDFLREQARQNKFELVSASILDPSSGKPLFQPYVIKEIRNPSGTGMLRVAITGFTRPSAAGMTMAAVPSAPAASQAPTSAPTPTPTPRVAPTPTERKAGVWVPAPGHEQLAARVTPTPPTEETRALRELQERIAKRQAAEAKAARDQESVGRLNALRNLLNSEETIYAPSLHQAETQYQSPVTQPVTQPASLPTVEPTPAPATSQSSASAPSPSPTPFHGIEVKSDIEELTVLPKADPDEFKATDPKPILQKLIPELRQRADYVVVLAHFPRQNASAILEGMEGIDLLIAGYGSAEEPQIRDRNGMISASPGYTGRAIGRMMLSNDPATGAIKAEGEVVAINSTFSSQPDVAKLLNEYRQETRKLPTVQTEPIQYTLAGAESCKICHEEPFAKWKQMRHSHAFNTLVEQNQHFNPECLPCHTTSFMKDNGFRDISTTKQFTDVQCESCHGPSLQHVVNERNLKFGVNFQESYKESIRKQIMESMPIVKPGPEVCMECHTTKTDPKFDYETKLPIISHKDAALVRNF